MAGLGGIGVGCFYYQIPLIAYDEMIFLFLQD